MLCVVWTMKECRKGRSMSYSILGSSERSVEEGGSMKANRNKNKTQKSEMQFTCTCVVEAPFQKLFF